MSHIHNLMQVSRKQIDGENSEIVRYSTYEGSSVTLLGLVKYD